MSKSRTMTIDSDTLTRFRDTALIVVALPVLIPIVTAVAVVVRIFLGAPVIFRQTRPGQFGRPFELLKFRTMTEGRDAAGNLLPDEQRLTRLGQFLRSSSLDELPEILNVLKGEMRLVGPRPLLLEYLPLYSARQARRHEVPPGITGLAQVSGRNSQTWEDRLETDVRYVETRSFTLDVQILARTLTSVFMREGISADGHATMPLFRGSLTEAP